MEQMTEYLIDKGFNCYDYTDKFKTKKEFEDFKDCIGENYKDFSDMLYYFDLQKCIPEIGKYYNDKFDIDTSNHYLVLLSMKFNIIEKDTIMTPESFDNLIKMPSKDKLTAYYNDKTGKIKYRREYNKPRKLKKHNTNGFHIISF